MEVKFTDDQVKTGNDGSKTLSVDFGAMGFVSAEKVDQIRAESYAKGAEKSSGDLAPQLEDLRKQNEGLLQQIEAAKKGKGSTALENEQLRQELGNLQGTVRQLTEAAEAERNERKRLSLENSIKDAMGKLPLVEGGAQAFQLSARSALVEEDGVYRYKLASGINGSLEEFSAEWRTTPLGKMSLVSSQSGGSGFGFGGSAAEKPGSAYEKAAYIKQHGLAEFRRQVELGNFKEK